MDSPTAAGTKDPERASKTQLYEGGQGSRTSDRVDSGKDQVAEGVTLAHPEIQSLLERSTTADKTAPKADIVDADNKMSLEMNGLYSTVFNPTAKGPRPTAATDSASTKTSSGDNKDQAVFKDYDSKKGREEYLKEKREQGIAPPELEHGPRRNTSPGDQLHRGLSVGDSRDGEGGRERSISTDRSISGARETAREDAPGVELESFFAEDPAVGGTVDPGDGKKGENKGNNKDDNKDSGRDHQPPGGDRERRPQEGSDSGPGSGGPRHDGTTAAPEPDLTGAEQSTHVIKPEESIDSITGSNLGDAETTVSAKSMPGRSGSSTVSSRVKNRHPAPSLNFPAWTKAIISPMTTAPATP